MEKIMLFARGTSEILSVLWRSSRKQTVMLAINNLIRNALWPLRALIVKQIVDIIVLSTQKGFLQYQNALYINLIFFFILFWANRIWWPLNSYTQTLMLAKISNEVKTRIIDIMERIDLSFFDDSKNYDIYSNAVAQTDGRRPINVVNNILNLCSIIISFGIALTAMLQLNVMVTAILLASSIPSVIWESKFNNKIYEFDQRTVRQRRLLGYIFGLFVNKSAAKEIREFDTTEYLSNKHAETLKDYNRESMKLVKLKLGVDSVFWFVLQAAVIFSYYVVISMVSNKMIQIGQLSFFMAVAVDIQNSIKNIGASINGTVDSSKYINNLMKLEDVILNKTCGNGSFMKLPQQIASIEFRNVSFAYPTSEEFALRNLNFKLMFPEKVIIVGENGSGKTTLIKLLLRFYEPAEGEILLNGINVNQFDLCEYRSFFTACFQDFVKYGFTLKENILLANTSMKNEELYEIIDRTQLNECINNLPGRLDTYLAREYDENGVELSGGQYNRIAIARALAKKASIVVLDEPNASLDAKAEQNLFALYEGLSDNKLAIMVTHRLSTAVKADKILVMNDGELAEQGNHKQLMLLRNQYYKLFTLQARQYINEEAHV